MRFGNLELWKLGTGATIYASMLYMTIKRFRNEKVGFNTKGHRFRMVILIFDVTVAQMTCHFTTALY